MKYLLLISLLSASISFAQNCIIDNLNVTSNEDSLCFPNNGVTVSAANSQVGYNYYLEEAISGTTIDGPITGTGASIVFATGPIGVNTSYVVIAERATNALKFDGVDDVVHCGTGLTLLGDFTLEVWVRHTTGTDWQTYVANIDYSADQGYWLGSNISGEVAFYISTGSWVLGTTTIADSNWHHVAAVYSGGSGYLYIDGSLEGSSVMSNSLTTTQPFTIGDDSNPLNYKYTGDIGGVRVWNVGRTDAEINTDMNNCLVGDEAGLMAYYTFEDVGGSTLTDLTSDPNDGTLINMDPSADWIAGNFSCCTMEMSQQIDVSVFDTTTTISLIGTDTLSANAGLETYQWIDCTNGNQAIIGETGMIYVPTITGSYAVIVSLGACIDTSACIQANLGLDEFDLFKTTYLYPNPSAYGKIKISGEIEITDVHAYDILERAVPMIYHPQTRTIRLRGRTTGTYLIHIQSEDKLIIRKMLLAN
ncbi:MAG: hypothetical protein ACI865_002352 [Flavobacteriaceae bacterium]|jgi:hypothetical protein